MTMNSNNIDSTSEIDVEVVELLPKDSAPLNLETLNSDCQQLILDYFEFEDLLNVAETSKSLHVAACAAFKRKYGQKNVGIGLGFCYTSNAYLKNFANGKGIIIYHDLNSLKVLRNFGCTISSLFLMHLSHRNSDILKDIIPFYVYNYCSMSLHTLQIRGYSKLTQSIFNCVENPYTNLKRLIIQMCRYKSTSWNFDSAVFPNLQTLKIRLNKMESTDSPKIELKKIPALKSFSFDDSRDENIETITSIIHMVKLNTQLEKFEIVLHEQFDEQNIDALMQCLSCLPNLQRLNLILAGPKSAFNALDSYHFNNVVDFGLFNIPLTFSMKIPFTFNKLKRFIITTSNKTRTEHLNHAQIWDFLVNNKHLTSIFLHGRVNGASITNYENLFSNLEELYIHQCEDIPIDSVFGFLKNRLKKFRIAGTRRHIRRNYNEISDILDSHGIEFKSKFCFYPLTSSFGVPPLRCADFPLINYFIEHGIFANIDFYSKDKLECYYPFLNPYIYEYYCPENF